MALCEGEVQREARNGGSGEESVFCKFGSYGSSHTHSYLYTPPEAPSHPVDTN